MSTRKLFRGDPAFAEEMERLADARRDPPLSDDEKARLAEPVTREWSPLHKHEDACWGRPYEVTIRDAAGTHRVMVQECRYSGTKREAPR